MIKAGGCRACTMKVADVAFNVVQQSLIAMKKNQRTAVFWSFPELCITGYTCG
jgi:predicted amidohydrolase